MAGKVAAAGAGLAAIPSKKPRKLAARWNFGAASAEPAGVANLGQRLSLRVNTRRSPGHFGIQSWMVWMQCTGNLRRVTCVVSTTEALPSSSSPLTLGKRHCWPILTPSTAISQHTIDSDAVNLENILTCLW